MRLRFGVCSFSVCAILAPVIAEAASFRFETFQFPGASITTPVDVNSSGQIVGIAQGLGKNIGFLLDGGVFTPIDVPGAGALNGTRASGINDAGTIVGTFVTETGQVISHGFVLEGGVLTTIDVPGARTTQVEGINDLGQVVGRIFESSGPSIGRGFLLDGNDVELFDAPGASGPFGTGPASVNSQGRIVGRFLDANGFHGFLLANEIFRIIEFGASPSSIAAAGINDRGQIVGSFRDPFGVQSHGFLIDDGDIFQIDVPGVTTTFGTNAIGISDQGHIVGAIDVIGSPSQLGFLATPCSGGDPDCIALQRIGGFSPVPEPGTVGLILTGLALARLTRRGGSSRASARDRARRRGRRT